MNRISSSMCRRSLRPTWKPFHNTGSSCIPLLSDIMIITKRLERCADASTGLLMRRHSSFRQAPMCAKEPAYRGMNCKKRRSKEKDCEGRTGCIFGKRMAGVFRQTNRSSDQYDGCEPAIDPQYRFVP